MTENMTVSEFYKLLRQKEGEIFFAVNQVFRNVKIPPEIDISSIDITLLDRSTISDNYKSVSVGAVTISACIYNPRYP